MGEGSDGRSANPPVLGEAVTFRYFLVSEATPIALRGAFERTGGASDVSVDAVRRIMKLTWNRKCTDMHSLEGLAAGVGVPAYLLSHTHVLLSFKGEKGANLTQLNEEMGRIPGVKGILTAGVSTELHADMETLDAAKIRAMAKSAGFEVQFRSHQWIEVSVSAGQAGKAREEIENLKGVLLVRPVEGGLGFWTVKSVTDAMVRKALEKVGITPSDLRRP